VSQYRAKEHYSQDQILEYMYSKHLISPTMITKALHSVGVDLSHGTTIENLSDYDHDHFGGVKDTEECFKLLSIDTSSRLLDIGSGLGGPARYIADRSGARVIGIEIQRDRFETAQQFTKVVSLDHLVSFVNEDFSSVRVDREGYTHVISFLSILHMIDKKRVLQKLATALRPGGVVLIEDYYSTIRLSNDDRITLLQTISCPTLLRRETYIKTLEKFGIRINEVTDMTQLWNECAVERVKEYQNNLITLRKQFGSEAALNALNFAQGVMRIFDRGLISGMRLLGEKI